VPVGVSEVGNSVKYPFATEMILRLYNDGLLTNVATLEVEPEFGYAFRIRYKKGAVRMGYSADVGLNTGAAHTVTEDKAFTKHFLRLSGFATPKGQTFLFDWWADLIGAKDDSVRRVDKAIPYIRAELPYPVYVKPVDGSRGINVWKCHNDQQVLDVLRAYERERVRVALVEETIPMPDFRIVVLDNEVISVYRRVPLQVLGNGTSTVEQLLSEAQSAAERSGRATKIPSYNPMILARLESLGLTMQYVPGAGENLQLLDVSNLSAGGTAIDLSDTIDKRWADLALNVANAFGLRFCGIDIVCDDISNGHGDYAILEVNATPGLNHYGAVGDEQDAVVRNLYARVLNIAP
jgi:D-alanine-D-alanine ligase-like ATP-grasp enzyme